jgi:hypothetical protein
MTILILSGQMIWTCQGEGLLRFLSRQTCQDSLLRTSVNAITENSSPVYLRYCPINPKTLHPMPESDQCRKMIFVIISDIIVSIIGIPNDLESA